MTVCFSACLLFFWRAFQFPVYYMQESLYELPWVEWQKGDVTICCNGLDRHEKILMCSSTH